MVGAAFALQAGLAALVLYVPWGNRALQTISGGVSALLGYAHAGTEFIFGPLAKPEIGGNSFAIAALPVIIFFAALVSILYHVGIMQRIVRWLGGAIGWITGIDRVEALGAKATQASNLKTGLLVEAVEGAETIKSGQGGWRMLSQWMQTTDEARDYEMHSRAIQEHAQHLMASFQQISYVLLVASGINFVDLTGAQMLGQEARRRRALGGALYLFNMKDEPLDMLRRSGMFEAIGAENFFTMGDVGYFDEDGFLILMDRKKDLIKTSGGKYIAPQYIEGKLKAIGVSSARRVASLPAVPTLVEGGIAGAAEAIGGLRPAPAGQVRRLEAGPGRGCVSRTLPHLAVLPFQEQRDEA